MLTGFDRKKKKRNHSFDHAKMPRSEGKENQDPKLLCITRSEHFNSSQKSTLGLFNQFAVELPKPDLIYILGVYDFDDSGESQEDREYIDYGVKCIAKKYQTKGYAISTGTYCLEKGSIPDLSKLTSSSKLILIGHSSENEFNEFTFAGKESDHLVELLFEDCELQQVGKMVFISCYLASMAYIEKFKDELPENCNPIIIAYTQPLMMGLNGKLSVDLGEDLGVVSAKPYKIEF